MAYVIEVDVESELSETISATSQPTTTELADFIADIEADVNAVLYSVGISTSGIDSSTTPIVFRVVKQWALWGICSRALAAMSGAVTVHLDKEAWYWDRYQAKREEVLGNPSILGADAPFSTATSSLGVRGLTDDSDESYDVEFTRDKEY